MGSEILGEAQNDGAGTSVDLSGTGTRIAVGSPTNSNVASFAGHVRVFDWNGAAWVQVGQNIDVNPVSGSSFGMAVSLSDDGSRVRSADRPTAT